MSKPFLIFGREPALLLSAVAVVIQFVSTFFFNLSTDQQGVLNIVAAAVVALLAAWAVKRDALVPAVLGLVQAGLAALLAFGVDLSAEHQSAVVALVAVTAGWFTRTQVTAKVDANGNRVAS